MGILSKQDGAAFPVHGFVLAGGKSSRMGRDKALLPFAGRPMVEIAVQKLRGFCSEVSIAGNRDDLAGFAPVVHEARLDTGPAAGMEAGLLTCDQPWALFLPVDVPLLPAALLKEWAGMLLAREKVRLRLSFLRACDIRHAACCLLHRDCLAPLSAALDHGERKLGVVFERIASALGPDALWVADAEDLVPQGISGLDLPAWFGNINTPEDLAALMAHTRSGLE